MHLKDLLHRARLDVIETFILSGDEKIEVECEKSYSQQLDAASKKVEAFFESRYNNDELDEICKYYYEQTAVYQEVYFEIGLIVGAKIAFDLRGKIEELQ